MGRVPCDLQFTRVRYLDVFSCEWREGTVSVHDGVIVSLDEGLKAHQTIDGKGRALAPGFLDAHVHIESSLMVPRQFERSVLPRGTTTVICDPHELANVAGIDGIRYFLEQAQQTAMNLQVMLSSCVPATTMETNGAGPIESDALAKLKSYPHALGLAEMMNVPGVLFGDSQILDKIEEFSDGMLDGHCPLLRGQSLSAYASAGISSCHESSQLEEAREKLIKGISVWIREGSVAKDLHTLAPLLTLATSTSIGFCTDDRNPLDIAKEGHIDYLVREAIRMGRERKVSAEVFYRASSWSVARHYGLNVGPERIGAVAPGYGADLILLDDVDTCSVSQVFRMGLDQREILDQIARKKSQTGGIQSDQFKNSVRASVPDAVDLQGPKGRVHVIEVEPGKIITGRRVCAHDARGVAHLSVLERYGRGTKPANGYVYGFGDSLRGAIASSVGHDSHNLIVVSESLDEMRVALAALIQSGGGFVVVQNGKVISQLALPIGGLMSEEEPSVIAAKLTELRKASQAIGCQLLEPFLQLAFLSLPVIPSLKLTDQGLVDVDLFKIISVSA